MDTFLKDVSTLQQSILKEHQLQQDTTTETTTTTTTTATNNNIIQSHAFKTERFALYADMCQLVNGLF